MASSAEWQELVKKTQKKEKCTYREAQQKAKPIWKEQKEKLAKKAAKASKAQAKAIKVKAPPKEKKPAKVVKVKESSDEKIETTPKKRVVRKVKEVVETV